MCRSWCRACVASTGGARATSPTACVRSDTIMTFEGRFAEQILPSQLHILNVSFLVPGLRREYGGCAGNIAYGLRQLGAQAVPLAMVGNDAQDYLGRLQGLGVDR